MTQHPERNPDEVVILVRNNGPFRVYGPAKLVDADGKAYEIPAGDWYTLCRCGHSNRKPFCDSTHKTIDFVAPSDSALPIDQPST